MSADGLLGYLGHEKPAAAEAGRAQCSTLNIGSFITAPLFGRQAGFKRALVRSLAEDFSLENSRELAAGFGVSGYDEPAEGWDLAGGKISSQ